MAVENKYADANLEAEKLTTAAFAHGDKTVVIVSTFEVAAADDNLSVYRIAKAIPSDLIPLKFELYNDAITGATDYDIGLYDTTTGGVAGAVINKDVFLDGEDIASGNARGAPVDGLTAVDIVDAQKRIYEHAGDTLDSIGGKDYDIAVTANVVGSTAGTVTVIMWFVQG